MPVILVYRGGAKGDLLCNFLLDQVSFGINGRNETIGEPTISLRNLDNRMIIEDQTIVSNKAVEAILKYPSPICSSHSMDRYPIWFLEKMKKTHDFVFIDSDDFHRNSLIDCILKRYMQEASTADKLISLSMGFKSVKSLKYKIDLEMLSRGYSLSDDNRRTYIKSKLQCGEDFEPLNNQHYFNVIRYVDLFFPPFEGMKTIMSLIRVKKNLEDWKSLVIRSYLPKEVDVFGEIVYPADYGYVWHYEKDVG